MYRCIGQLLHGHGLRKGRRSDSYVRKVGGDWWVPEGARPLLWGMWWHEECSEWASIWWNDGVFLFSFHSPIFVFFAHDFSWIISFYTKSTTSTRVLHWVLFSASCLNFYYISATTGKRWRATISAPRWPTQITSTSPSLSAGKMRRKKNLYIWPRMGFFFVCSSYKFSSYLSSWKFSDVEPTPYFLLSDFIRSVPLLDSECASSSQFCHGCALMCAFVRCIYT